MDSSDVRVFLAVAREGSLARAGERLGQSQPTLSKAIARLEREHKVKLFERLARGMRLTEAGHCFLHHAEQFDLGALDLHAALRDLRQARAGLLRFGAGQGVPDAIVTAVAQTLIQQGVALDLMAGMTDTLQRAVAAGDIEFAILGLPGRPQNGLGWTSLCPDPMVPIVARDHPLAAARAPVPWSTLAQAKWIVPAAGTSTFGEFVDNFARHGLDVPQPCMASRASHRELEVGAAVGAVVLVTQSHLAVTAVRERFVALRPRGGWVSARKLGMVYRKGGYRSVAAQQAMACVQAAVRR